MVLSTAIDDAPRVRVLKICERHSQANAIDFIDHIIEKFPFRIREIRSDNGHEFQVKFHWHAEDNRPERPFDAVYLALCAHYGREPTEAEIDEVVQAMLRGIDQGIADALGT